MRLTLPIALAAGAALLSGCVMQQTYDQKVQEAEQLHTANRTLNRQLEDTRADNSRLTTELQTLSKRMRDSQAHWEDELNALQKSLEDKDNQLDKLYRESDRLTADKQQLGQKLEREKVARAARIANIKNTYDQLVGTLEDELKQERAAREAAAARVRQARTTLEKSLAAEIGRKEIGLAEENGRLTINLSAKLLFDLGQADVNPAGQGVLKKVGAALKGLEDRRIRVEGYTDSLPITGPLKEKYPSNWELSAARAASVVRYLQTASGIPGERLAIAGYAQFQPVASNDTPEGRALNRRIQITLIPLLPQAPAKP